MHHKHHHTNPTTLQEVIQRIEEAQAWGFRDFAIITPYAFNGTEGWLVFAEPGYEEGYLETADHMHRTEKLSVGWPLLVKQYGDKAQKYHIEHCIHHEGHDSREYFELYVWLKDDA